MSHAHLRLIFKEYEKLTKKSIESTVESEFSGDIKAGLLAVVKFAKMGMINYLADRLHQSIKVSSLMSSVWSMRGMT